MNEPEPITKLCPSAFPPSKATPSLNPSKSMLAVSPFSISLSESTNLEAFSCNSFNLASTSSSVTL